MRDDYSIIEHIYYCEDGILCIFESLSACVSSPSYSDLYHSITNFALGVTQNKRNKISWMEKLTD